MLLRRALTDAGRMPKQAAPLPKRGRPPIDIPNASSHGQNDSIDGGSS
jgi:hypothetical protein